MSRHLLLGAVLAAPLLIPATAPAATTFGTSPDVAISETPLSGCPGIAPAPCTVGQDRLSNLDLRVSENGVVVRWGLHGQGGQARLRRVGGGATAAGALPAAAGKQEFAAQLPVKTGDRLAVDLLDGAQISRQPAFFPSDADLADTWAPPLADGETRAPSETFEGYLIYQAVIEPDRDGDGLGDESQDPDHGTPVVVGPPEPRPPVDDPPRPPVTTVDPYAGLPAAGPTLKLAATATATRAGVVSLSLTNPYTFKLSGRAVLRQGRRTAGTATVKLGASGSSIVRLRLSKPVARTLARKRAVKLSLAVTLRAPVGKARTTRRTVTVKLGAPPRRATPRTPARRDDGGGTTGRGGSFDGTYRASDGQVMAVEGGVVKSFSGDLTLYCTKSGKQKRVAYGMFGDDPDPTIAADGTFAYEATTGYGFLKLKYDGRIQGDTATGKLMVEDRSPLLGGDKIDFDYCYAGKEWTLTR